MDAKPRGLALEALSREFPGVDIEEMQAQFPHARWEEARAQLEKELREEEPFVEHEIDVEEGPAAEHEIDAESEGYLLPDRYWKKLGERGQGAHSLFDADLKKKAYRYADCARRGEKLECSTYPAVHRFFNPYHCLLRFCKDCGGIHSRRLFSRMVRALGVFFAGHDHPSSYQLMSFDFNKRCDGSAPTSDGVRDFNKCVRSTLKKASQNILRILALRGDEAAARLLKRRKVVFAAVFVDEFGAEKGSRHMPDEARKAGGLNLHAHGRYYGPWLPDWKEAYWIFRETWKHETVRFFGEKSFGFTNHVVPGWRLDPARAAKGSMRYILKYVRKPAWETVERMAQLEKAFDGARMVHVVGLWYGLKGPEEHIPRGSGFCPICEKQGRKSSLHYLGRELLPKGGSIPQYWPVDVLQQQGYLNLEAERHRLRLGCRGAPRGEEFTSADGRR